MRDHWIRIRVTGEEKEAIKAKAKASDHDVTDFILISTGVRRVPRPKR